jgi:hypothetical protein
MRHLREAQSIQRTDPGPAIAYRILEILQHPLGIHSYATKIEVPAVVVWVVLAREHYDKNPESSVMISR